VRPYRLLIVLLALLVLAPAAQAQGLRAGAGRADITPPTGYHFLGWVRADSLGKGQHTRLFARAIVLERDGRKLALVAADLGAIPGGMLADAAARVPGFSEQNVIASASHTHAGPTGFFNFGAYNTIFPTRGTPTEFNTAADRQLYGFMVRQFAAAIERADRDLGPAAAAWGESSILGLTRNRSIEAHLHNHGIVKEFGEGSVADDPAGYAETISPEVHALRVDKLRGRRRVPIGMWSTFSAHGTVNPHTFTVYNADHHGAAARVVEAKIRRAGRVPRRQEVVNAFGNADEGDVSAGLDQRGPVHAEYVGRREASAMLEAWRAAGRELSRTPALDSRWTRVCFCGQETEGGSVDTRAVIGVPLFTGSEEGRGPLYDETQVPFEGRRNPVPLGPQGHKAGAPVDTDVPKAVPLTAARLGDRVLVTIPGEMTAGMGHRVQASVLGAASPVGVRRAVISGLANEFLQYFTTPEEYDRQHYEGGSTLYGRQSSNLLMVSLRDLTARLVAGDPAPDPYPYDPRNGLTADDTPFGAGAPSARVVDEPSDTRRLQHTSFAWIGGERGLDRPLERAFVSVRRHQGRRRPAVATDLGLRILWTVDDDGRYEARWEVPLRGRGGIYSFRVSANRYMLESEPFRVSPSRALSVRRVDAPDGRAAVELAYPAASEDDFTFRRAHANGGRVVFRVNGRRVRVRRSRGSVFSVRAPAGATVTVAKGAARDRYGNRNSEPLSFTR
jgi:neutral ceramidase